MNTWQLLRQIKATLEAATWADASQEPVFGQVIASSGFPREARPGVRFPLARVYVGDSTTDPEAVGLNESTIFVELTQQVRGDRTGEAALIGGARGGGQGSSGGRGLLEIEEELLSAIGSLARLENVTLRMDATSAAEASQDPELGYVVWRVYAFTARLTRDRTYPPAVRLAAADGGGQTVDLTWQIPGARFDRVSLVLRRASGSTPPSSVTAGTGVTVGDTDTSVTDSVGLAGSYAYALFVGYDETGSGTADRYSAANTATVTVA